MKAASTTEQRRPPLDEATDRAAKLFLASVRRRYRVREAWLFGSRARGDAHIDSDADIALSMEVPEGDFVSTKLALDDLAYDVLLDTGVHIQPLPLWMSQPEEPSRFANPGLIRAVRRNGVALRHRQTG